MKLANRYQIPAWLAQSSNAVTEFVAIPLAETEKAVYLWGHGTGEATGSCMRCGRELTHPVSILAGIGPECGQHYWDESILGPYGMTEAHLERLRQMVRDIKIDGWFPKSRLTLLGLADEEIPIPQEHPMVIPRNPDTKQTQTGSKRTATIVCNTIVIKFEYTDPDFKQLLPSVKILEGRRWNDKTKSWITPLSIAAAKWCKDNKFKLDPQLEKWIESKLRPNTSGPINPKGFGIELFEYQKEGVGFIDALGGRAIIGDDMGLGKTAEAAAWIHYRRDRALPALIVCPASVKYHWRNKLQEWIPNIKAHVLEGKPKKGETLPVADIYISNYDILAQSSTCPNCGGAKYDAATYQKCRKCSGTGKVVQIRDGLRKARIQTIVADECHYLKETTANRTKAFLNFVRGEGAPKHIIPMSGTPIKNKPIEWFTILNLVAPETFPTWFGYVTKYCDGHQTQYGWDVSGHSNTEELHQLVRRYMLRRTKDQVLKQLPPKMRSVVPLNNIDRAYYEMELRAMKAWIVELKARAKAGDPDAQRELRSAAMVKIEALKQTAVKAKLDAAIGWIEDYLLTEEKIVLFAHHKDVVDELMAGLGKYNPVKVDGSTIGEQRQEAVDRFQKDPNCRVFVGSQAAKEGITLTAAHATCFVELWWTPGDHDQAEDRVHRIGQEHDSVTAYYLLADRTIEVDIARILDQKRSVLSKVVDGKDVEQEKMLGQLLDILSE